LLKESYVVPLFKSGDKKNISKYHVISILSVIPKLFAKLVCDVMTLIICPSISDEQHGFISERSMVTSSLVDFSTVFTDFLKAFGRVNLRLLLGTLTQKFCVRMIFWLGSYFDYLPES
jgi:hypothetical protein